MLWLCLPLHRMQEKGRKDCPIAANMGLKGGQIEVADLTGWLGKAQTGGNDMGGTDKNNEPPKNEPPKRDDGKSKKSPPATTEDDDREDGDFATPKRDRYGDDDQPL
jgi:hypothetical protein